MTQIEFETRTGVNVNTKEFDAINEVYMSSDLDKDAFCKAWKKMNASRVEAAKEARKAKAEKDALLDKLYGIYEMYWIIPTNEQNKLAPDFLTLEQREWLEGLGIEMRYEPGIYGIRFFKPIYSVLYEVEQYIKKTVAAEC